MKTLAKIFIVVFFWVGAIIGFLAAPLVGGVMAGFEKCIELIARMR